MKCQECGKLIKRIPNTINCKSVCSRCFRILKKERKIKEGGLKFCKMEGCDRAISKGSKTGYCVHHRIYGVRNNRKNWRY